MPYKNKNQKLKHDREYYYKNRERILDCRKQCYHKCLNCDKLIVPQAKRCHPCANKNRKKNGEYISLKGKKSLSKHMEENNPMKNPETVKKVIKTSKRMGHYKQQRIRMKNGGAIKARMANDNFPNKPEKIIINIIKDNHLPFVYVGGGKKWLKGKAQYFNPDFINKKIKLIIEFFGDYWHNLPKAKIKDKERLKTYAKYGYKTLIVWEHELKNKNHIINKIRNFTR